MFERTLRSAIATAVALACSTVWAQEENTADRGSLEEVLVTGRAKHFYLDTSTSVGSKLGLDLVELPQSAQILTEQLIIDQAARDITDLYRSVAGVSEFSYSGIGDSSLYSQGFWSTSARSQPGPVTSYP